ncbi:MAG: hypothetical protein KJ947_04205 [Alphaproteobacteria bacterium]|jgi:hypothetical protein|nr:hypothetical protein [Alphaproteobacteria bacterium]MBU1548766.1 hypothetical protein [Alphaproteobacteria bacterium]MBU2335592.1 hypothetical protein [Alphaproteobacteria bacterium]MBU2391013.1 hypothetical protein [Alphaproteobacteria bacterium]
METQPFIIQGSSPVPTKIFYPQQTVRCISPAVFRGQLARDIACLLDVDDEVTSWSCFSEVFHSGEESYRPDLIVEREQGRFVFQAIEGSEAVQPWLPDAVRSAGLEFRLLTRDDLPAVRLRNAKDLLRYARYEVTLDDRVRLLAALDDHGSLTVGECLSVFRKVLPIPGLASLVLARVVTVDLDEKLIGPETIVRRFRA